MSSKPLFSIVIPTRNRSDTLRHSVQTCLDVDHPSYEILVSDNSSTDDTPAVLAAFQDPRVRHVRTPEYVSMSRNYEFALRHVQGEFIIFIGDDDGILPFGLRVLEGLFAKYPKVDTIDWALNGFVWPHRNTALFSLNFLSNLGTTSFETAEDAWKRVNAPRSSDYNELNGFNLYHGCVRRRVLDAAAAAGVSLPGSAIPDVAASFRITRFSQLKLRLDVAITPNGTSKHSNGWAHFTPKPVPEQLRIRSEFHAKATNDFPGSLLGQYDWSRANCFLGPLADEHVERTGNLSQLDLTPWRKIYADAIAGRPPEDWDGMIAEADAIFSQLEGGGARAAAHLVRSDIEGLIPLANRLPRLFNQPYSFNASTVEMARRAGPLWRHPIEDARLLAIVRRPADMAMSVRSPQGEFTVSDYVQLTTEFFRCEPFDTAELIVNDPELFRSIVTLRVLDYVASQPAT